MKYKIVKNEGRKTITLIISPVTLQYVGYLFKKYVAPDKKEKYFANGILRGSDYQKDILPMVKDLVKALNEAAGDVFPKGEAITVEDFVSTQDGDFKFISPYKDKDGKWDGKEFQINLQSRSKDENKKFLFEDLACTVPVKEDDGWKNFYAMEIEISAGYNDDKMEKFVFTIFHRAVACGRREVNEFKQNDDAWSGFNFRDPEDDPV